MLDKLLKLAGLIRLEEVDAIREANRRLEMERHSAQYNRDNMREQRDYAVAQLQDISRYFDMTPKRVIKR
jgi:hypothetical protein